MRANFQFLVPSTTLGADGIGQNFNVSAPLSLTFVNLSSSTSATISLTDEDGRTQTYTVLAGLSYGPSVSLIRTWAFTGSGATVAAIFTSAETQVPVETLRSMLVSVSGTVNTDVGQGTAPSSQVVLTEPLGTAYDARDRLWNLNYVDAQGVYFTGGTAPASGVWTLTVGGTGSVPAVNGAAFGTTLAADTILTVTLAVKSGSTYAVTGCTVLDGWISVG